MNFKEVIEKEFDGEERDKLLVGRTAAHMNKHALNSFISHITRLPRSGGHKKVRLFVGEAIDAYFAYLKKKEEEKRLEP